MFRCWGKSHVNQDMIKAANLIFLDIGLASEINIVAVVFFLVQCSDMKDADEVLSRRQVSTNRYIWDTKHNTTGRYRKVCLPS